MKSMREYRQMSKTYNLIDPQQPDRKMTITLADDGTVLDISDATCPKITMIYDHDLLGFQYDDAIRGVCGRCEQKGSTNDCPKGQSLYGMSRR